VVSNGVSLGLIDWINTFGAGTFWSGCLATGLGISISGTGVEVPFAGAVVGHAWSAIINQEKWEMMRMIELWDIDSRLL